MEYKGLTLVKQYFKLLMLPKHNVSDRELSLKQEKLQKIGKFHTFLGKLSEVWTFHIIFGNLAEVWEVSCIFKKFPKVF